MLEGDKFLEILPLPGISLQYKVAYMLLLSRITSFGFEPWRFDQGDAKKLMLHIDLWNLTMHQTTACECNYE